LREANVEAYVLVQTEVGAAADVSDDIGALEGVVSAEATTGPYDVIARVRAESVDALGQLVVSRIQLIGGVTRTLTCPIVHL
jgi:DNA-binding Lrp family transcriptional regulator